jgi:hypothetical protein
MRHEVTRDPVIRVVEQNSHKLVARGDFRLRTAG